MERERPRAEEARVSGPPSSPRLLPRVPWGCSHSLSIPLQGDNHEGDPGCAGSPGLPGPPGLPGQRGEEVRAWAGPRGGWSLHLNDPWFLRAVSFLPAVSLDLLVASRLPRESFRGHKASGHPTPLTVLASSACLAPRASSQCWAPGHSSSLGLQLFLLQGLLPHPFSSPSFFFFFQRSPSQ